MRDPARAALSTGLVTNQSSFKYSKSKLKEGSLSTNCEVVQYLIRKYASDDIIAQTEPDLVKFNQPSNMKKETYASKPW